MNRLGTLKVRIDGDPAAGKEGLRPTLPVHRPESGIFRGWGPRL